MRSVGVSVTVMAWLLLALLAAARAQQQDCRAVDGRGELWSGVVGQVVNHNCSDVAVNLTGRANWTCQHIEDWEK